jgi:hypothetical protein
LPPWRRRPTTKPHLWANGKSGFLTRALPHRAQEPNSSFRVLRAADHGTSANGRKRFDREKGGGRCGHQAGVANFDGVMLAHGCVGSLHPTCPVGLTVMFARHMRASVTGRSAEAFRQTLLESCLCTQAQIESPAYAPWVEKLRPAWPGARAGEPILKRKFWEWLFIARTLGERGMLQPGRRGIGFGVGQEPQSAFFASMGCDILATDLEPSNPSAQQWSQTEQHAQGLWGLNKAGLCEPTLFAQRVRFRAVDMNHIPADLQGFDFSWSSCAFEHLGSILRGQDFILNQMQCLKPGGVAVHTTEFNVSSNRRTLDYTDTVLFRRRDIDELVQMLRDDGHDISVDFDTGDGPADRHVDLPPYAGDIHLKLLIGEKYTATSLGMVIRRSTEARTPTSHRNAGRQLRALGRRLDAFGREAKAKAVLAARDVLQTRNRNRA